MRKKIVGNMYMRMADRVTSGDACYESRATLVVVPSSIVEQWRSECHRWAPGLAVFVYPGAGLREVEARLHADKDKLGTAKAAAVKERERTIGRRLSEPELDALYKEVEARWSAQWETSGGEPLDLGLRMLRMRAHCCAADVVIASYDALTSDVAASKGKNADLWLRTGGSPLLQCYFQRVILDECQLTNAGGKGDIGSSRGGNNATNSRMQAAMALWTWHKWCVSGTPLSAPEDVRSALLFLGHQPFGKSHWWGSVLRPALALGRVTSNVAEVRRQVLELVHEAAQPGCTFKRMEQIAHSLGVPLPPQARMQAHYAALAAATGGTLSSSSTSHSAGLGLRLTSSAIDAIVTSRVASARAKLEAMPVVRRWGDGFDLLMAILRPVMWRNTQARVAALGQMALPPVTEVVVRVRLSQEEEHVHADLLRRHREGIVKRLREALQQINGAGGNSNSNSSSSAAAAAAGSTDAIAIEDGGAAGADDDDDEAMGACAGSSSSSSSSAAAMIQDTAAAAAVLPDDLRPPPTVLLKHLLASAHAALSDLRQTLAHVNLSKRAWQQLGLGGAAAIGVGKSGTSLTHVMALLTSGAETELRQARLAAAKAALTSAVAHFALASRQVPWQSGSGYASQSSLRVAESAMRSAVASLREMTSSIMNDATSDVSGELEQLKRTAASLHVASIILTSLSAAALSALTLPSSSPSEGTGAGSSSSSSSSAAVVAALPAALKMFVGADQASSSAPSSSSSSSASASAASAQSIQLNEAANSLIDQRIVTPLLARPHRHKLATAIAQSYAHAVKIAQAGATSPGAADAFSSDDVVLLLLGASNAGELSSLAGAVSTMASSLKFGGLVMSGRAAAAPAAAAASSSSSSSSSSSAASDDAADVIPIAVGSLQLRLWQPAIVQAERTGASLMTSSQVQAHASLLPVSESLLSVPSPLLAEVKQLLAAKSEVEAGSAGKGGALAEVSSPSSGNAAGTGAGKVASSSSSSSSSLAIRSPSFKSPGKKAASSRAAAAASPSSSSSSSSSSSLAPIASMTEPALAQAVALLSHPSTGLLRATSAALRIRLAEARQDALERMLTAVAGASRSDVRLQVLHANLMVDLQRVGASALGRKEDSNSSSSSSQLSSGDVNLAPSAVVTQLGPEAVHWSAVIVAAGNSKGRKSGGSGAGSGSSKAKAPSSSASAAIPSLSAKEATRFASVRDSVRAFTSGDAQPWKEEASLSSTSAAAAGAAGASSSSSSSRRTRVTSNRDYPYGWGVGEQAVKKVLGAARMGLSAALSALAQQQQQQQSNAGGASASSSSNSSSSSASGGGGVDVASVLQSLPLGPLMSLYTTLTSLAAQLEMGLALRRALTSVVRCEAELLTSRLSLTQTAVASACNALQETKAAVETGFRNYKGLMYLPQLYGATGSSDRYFYEKALERKMASALRDVSAKAGQLNYRIVAAQVAEKLQAQMLRQQKAASAAAGGAGAGASSSSSSAAATAAGAEEEDGFSCTICCESVTHAPVVALTPCSHLYCLGCIGAYVLSVNGLPTGGPGTTSASSSLRPTLAATCPDCRTPFRVHDLYTVDSRASGLELEVLPLTGYAGADTKAPPPTMTQSQAAAAASSSPSSAGAAASGASVRARQAMMVEDIDDDDDEEAGGNDGGNNSSGERLIAASSSSSSTATVAIAPTAVVNASRLLAGGASGNSPYGTKLTALVRRLRCLSQGDKAVVATMFPRLLDLAAEALRNEAIGAVKLRGSPSQRAEAVTTFVSRPAGEVKVLLLNVGTDCSGLTLTVANHLFVLDPVLSPAVMAQLTGRICRMGQVKPCAVVHLAVAGSTEERMIALRQKLAGVKEESQLTAAAAGASSDGAAAGGGDGGGDVSGGAVSTGADSATAHRLSPSDLLHLLAQ